MAPIRKLIYFPLVVAISLPLILSSRIFKATDTPTYDSLPKPRDYAYGEWIPLFADKVLGADERCEAYPYFALQFCPPGEYIPERKRSLNEILGGDCITNTQYELKFGIPVSEGFLCEEHLTRDDLTRFRSAIGTKFEYQMYFDDYWVRSKVGESIQEKGTGQKFYLFNHIQFNVDFMENRVMGINIVNSLDFSVDITNVTETELDFSYSVFWNDIKLKNNSNYYTSRNETAAEKTSWLTEEEDVSLVFSSFWLWTAITLWGIALLLVPVSPYLLRYLTKNRQRHRGIRRFNERTCHCPMFSSVLGATLGVGIQHLIIVVFLLISASHSIYPCNYEKISVDLVMMYFLTSVLSAFRARSFHEKFSRIGWKECIFQTGALYILPVFSAVLVVKMFVTSTLIVDRAVYILSKAGFGSAILMSLCIVMRHFIGPEYDSATCVTRRYVQVSTPSTLWFIKTPGQMIIGGLFPFLAIYFRMDEIYASLWGMKVCGSFITLFFAFVVVISSTFFIGYVYTSIQLLQNDWHWWWRSVLRGGSTAVYMFVYGLYFLSKIKTESYKELLPLLVYNGCICYSFFLVLGTVGFFASQLAVNYYPHGILTRS